MRLDVPALWVRRNVSGQAGQRATEVAPPGRCAPRVGLRRRRAASASADARPEARPARHSAAGQRAARNNTSHPRAHHGPAFAFAFTELSAARIVATTEHANLASQRVMQKLGMELRRNPLPEPPWLQVVGVLARATS